jgi:hypothetical protein
LGAGDALIEEVCDIVGHHHHPRPAESINFKCIYDADLIVNREEAGAKAGKAGREEGCEKAGTAEKAPLSAWIEKVLLTGSGRRLAASLLAKE